MPSSKAAHSISFALGVIFFLMAIYLAVFLPGEFFYTPFTIGSWLILDFIDYKLTNTSILTFFYSHRHYKSFFFLFLMSFFACFTVDFIWGVQTLKMWEWVHYTTVEYIRMYLIMNITFVLSMYELYRVIVTLLKPFVPEENILSLRIPSHYRTFTYVGVLCIGILFLISPLYFITFKAYSLTPFVQLFPFLSIALITDAITFFTKGTPILEEFVRLNKLKVVSVLLTVITAFIYTEGLNLFGKEWRYLRMPFYDVQILTVPIAVLIGWIPLVIGLLCMINMAKHLDYITTGHKRLTHEKEE